MTGLVLGHLVNGVVDGVETGSLSILGDTELILTGTSLSSGTLLQVGLRVPNTLAQQLCETTGMISLLEGIALESLCNLRIALTVSLTGHSQVHTNLTALSVEVITQVLNHLITHTLRLTVTNLMDGGIGHIGIILQFRELRGGSLTDWALLGSSVAFVDISTNGTDKLFLHNRICFMS